MGLQSVFGWFVEAILVWVIAGFAGWKFIDGIREQKIGKAVFSLLIGGAAYYFVKNPEQVLRQVGTIIAKFFGQG